MTRKNPPRCVAMRRMQMTRRDEPSSLAFFEWGEPLHRGALLDWRRVRTRRDEPSLLSRVERKRREGEGPPCCVASKRDNEKGTTLVIASKVGVRGGTYPPCCTGCRGTRRGVPSSLCRVENRSTEKHTQ